MIKENIALKSFRFILKDVFGDIVYWPIWWYTGGLLKAWNRMFNTIVSGIEDLSLMVWVKNLFKPMYGQSDWQGRLISFLMRLFQIIFRTIILLFWIIFALIIFLFWLILPIFLVFGVLFNLGIFGDKLW